MLSIMNQKFIIATEKIIKQNLTIDIMKIIAMGSDTLQKEIIQFITQT